MAVTNLYPNLPGHLVEFKDGGLQLTSKTVETSTTKSLLILGTATDGPINEPVKIDATTVSQVFGKEVDKNGYPINATLTKYAKQAFKNGFDDVRCMRVTGSQAYTIIEGEQITGTHEGPGESVTNDTTVNGNTGFAMSLVKDGTTNITFAPQDYNADGEFKVNDETQASLVLSSLQGTPYSSVGIPANVFGSEVQKIVYTTDKGLQFSKGLNGELSTSDTLILEADADTTDTSDPEHSIYGYKKEFRLGSGEKFFEGYTGSAIPELDALGLPIRSADNFTESNDGFYPFKITDTNNCTYTAVTDADDNIIGYDITLTSETELTDPSVDIVWYPYQEVQYNVENTDIAVAPYTIDCTSAISDIKAIETTEDASVKISAIVLTKDNDTLRLNANDLTSADVNVSIANDVVTITTLTNRFIGATATALISYDVNESRKLKLKVKSQWGGSLYKDGKVQVKKVTEDGATYTVVEFTKPSAKVGRGTETFKYSSQFYRTIDDLIFAMNNDNNNLNLFAIEIIEGEGTDSVDLLVEMASAQALTSGGDDGLNPTNNEMFIALSGDRYTSNDVGTVIDGVTVTEDMIGYLKTQGAYQILENYNVDFIYPAGIYADSEQTINPYSDFQRELALVCAVLTYRTKMTHGFIDVKPNSNTTLIGIDKYVRNLVVGHPNVYYMTDSEGQIIYDENEKPMDIGWYTSCVVGPEVTMTSDTLGIYYGSPAIAYAALNAVLEPQSAPTNKALRNVKGLKFKFSNKQLDALTGNRMVTFKLKNEGAATASSTPYVVDGVTSGATNCDYTRLSTVKVITDVVDQIRQVADPFIGEPNTVEQRNALSALISKRLAKLVEIGEIQAYEFEISATIQQQLLGEASIALTIIPALELRKITTVVALRAAQ